MMDASHTDINTAYAAVNRIRCDDNHPYIFKTTDGGATWKKIVDGLPMDPINVVKEDPVRKGLLFAGSETAVYVSLDDGAHWEPLRLNMPASSIRDLIIKNDDLVVATHGRSFWILDDITPLRQLTDRLAQQPVILYQPQTTFRVRWDSYTDTPMPPEEPAGQNPPDGAIIDYYLAGDAKDVRLEVLDQKGVVIRTYSNHDTLYKVPDINVPEYWLRPQQILSAAAGHHRFLWDMKYQPLNVPPSFPIAAIYRNTAPDATSPWVMPGNYVVRLTVDGKDTRQSFTIRMDPRVKTPASDLLSQFDLSMQCYRGRIECMKQLQALRQGAKDPGFGMLAGRFGSLHNALQDADVAPTAQQVAAVAALKKELAGLMNK